MKLSQIKELNIPTPAFIFCGETLRNSINNIREAADKAGCRLLYSLKPLTQAGILNKLSPFVDGFSVSSAFELRLARESAGEKHSFHITSPGLRKEDITEITRDCGYISFNSLSQWERFRDNVSGKIKCGLRINPEISFIDDERYDPCRENSKLGIPLDELMEIYLKDNSLLKEIDGLHFHTNCDSGDFCQLKITVDHIAEKAEVLLKKMKWICLGGGYLFDNPENIKDFYRTVDLLKNKYNLEVFIEPGASFVRDAGFVIASVMDILYRGGKNIAVLDTTVNHMPEVFEYQFEPDVAEYTEGAEFEYILAGCTCLPGDLFGEYSFKNQLKTGSLVVFENLGAYSLVKVHQFNGIKLPDIYYLSEEGELELIKKFSFEEYASFNGVNLCM